MLDAVPGEIRHVAVDVRQDVYKRQVEEMLSYLDKCRRELDDMETADDTLARLEPVSYTHLDVYKRQLPSSTRPHSFSGSCSLFSSSPPM